MKGCNDQLSYVFIDENRDTTVEGDNLKAVGFGGKSELVDGIFTDRVSWTVNTLQPYKLPDQGGFDPAISQNLFDLLFIMWIIKQH